MGMWREKTSFTSKNGREGISLAQTVGGGIPHRRNNPHVGIEMGKILACSTNERSCGYRLGMKDDSLE